MRTEVYGKWILSGEHTVLRGGSALVFPVLSQNLVLDEINPNSEFRLEFEGINSHEYQLIFPGVFEKACEQGEIDRSHLRGHYMVQSNLPIGKGLGASAAICVLVTKYLSDRNLVDPDAIYDFARRLENIFHGESSGVDIAGVMRPEGMRFRREQEPEPLSMAWRPRWFLTETGQRGVTSESVAKVKNLIERQPEKGARLDDKMKESVALCEEALLVGESSGFETLKSGIERAREVFLEWDLYTARMKNLEDELYAAGAAAVKPTGSGGGGFLLSLWKDDSWKDSKISDQLIRC